ncbi:MAG: putative transrane protein [Myxococcales bacterium]|nr:putative transrane protein [Myxococcales bacterium]
MGQSPIRGISTLLFAALLTASSIVAAPALGDETKDDGSVTRPTPRKRRKPKPETVASWHARRSLFFQRNWGVDIVGVRRVSSGLMLRFDYRVVDPARAVGLNDKKTKPYLIDEATGTGLAVPAMENIGELRQVAPFVVNRTYFIIFGNPGGLVKRGGKVTLVVGNLRAEGLIVD